MEFFFYGLGYDSLVFVGFYWYFCFYICYCVDEFGLGVGGVDYYFGFYCVFVGFQVFYFIVFDYEVFDFGVFDEFCVEFFSMEGEFCS